MRISKIEVENFRLLKSFSMDLEKELSLILGKNNTGKTSILTILDRFLNSSGSIKGFYFDDFNIEFKKELVRIIEQDEVLAESEYETKGITLKLYIEYDEEDDLSNVSRVMMDLDPENKMIVLGFEYTLNYGSYIKIRTQYHEFLQKEMIKAAEDATYVPRNILHFLTRHQRDFFADHRRSYSYDLEKDCVDTSIYIEIKRENAKIEDIINFKYISARRDVSNKEIDKTLSRQTSSIYKKTEVDAEHQEEVDKFQDALAVTDQKLTTVYSTLFDKVVEKVRTFGGIKPNESEIKIVSSLEDQQLLEGNTTVVYSHDGNHQLPEHYNGLGYMNLINMIFEIEILVQEFKRKTTEKPADINLLFIEEPEAHTHPQMQYVFIKNIKGILRDGIKRKDEIHRELQCIISTHSACIVADSDFHDLKFLKRNGTNSVVSKNLRDLEKEYEENGEDQNFRFLKQYLTLNRSELFFADKAIFIEGDTERILLPAIMRKMDQELPEDPLLSQNISVVEVGAHSKIFEKFIDFIGLEKALIITDIDSYYQEPDLESDGITQKTYKNGNPKFVLRKCPASDPNATKTSNNSLAFFHGTEDLSHYKQLPFDWKKMRKKPITKKWISNRKGRLAVVFQTQENGYHARSFEDSFFHVNKIFILDPTHSFDSLTPKYLEEYRLGTIDTFDFSEKAVGSKPSLAIEILLNSKTDANDKEYSNWEIPAYIKEGLLWLKKDRN